MSDLEAIDCPACGIQFHLEKSIPINWRKTGHAFFCPNGHPLAWPKPDPEIEILRKEITKLKEELEAAHKETATAKKLVEDLASELEIYKPVSIDKKENQ